MKEDILAFMNKLYLDYGAHVWCAGGAPLALHLEQKPKDYDIFIRRSEFKKVNPNNQFSFELYGHIFKPKFFGYHQGGTILPEVFSAKINDTKVDLVQVNDNINNIFKLIKGFDFDICECFLLSSIVCLSPAAKNAIKTKTITHRTHDTHFNQVSEKAAKRIARYQKKFPDYKIVEDINGR